MYAKENENENSLKSSTPPKDNGKDNENSEDNSKKPHREHSQSNIQRQKSYVINETTPVQSKNINPEKQQSKLQRSSSPQKFNHTNDQDDKKLANSYQPYDNNITNNQINEKVNENDKKIKQKSSEDEKPHTNVYRIYKEASKRKDDKKEEAKPGKVEKLNENPSHESSKKPDENNEIPTSNLRHVMKEALKRDEEKNMHSSQKSKDDELKLKNRPLDNETTGRQIDSKPGTYENNDEPTSNIRQVMKDALRRDEEKNLENQPKLHSSQKFKDDEYKFKNRSLDNETTGRQIDPKPRTHARIRDNKYTQTDADYFENLNSEKIGFLERVKSFMSLNDKSRKDSIQISDSESNENFGNKSTQTEPQNKANSNKNSKKNDANEQSKENEFEKPKHVQKSIAAYDQKHDQNRVRENNRLYDPIMGPFNANHKRRDNKDNEKDEDIHKRQQNDDETGGVNFKKKFYPYKPKLNKIWRY